jgi:hypothetical protein
MTRSKQVLTAILLGIRDGCTLVGSVVVLLAIWARLL